MTNKCSVVGCDNGGKLRLSLCQMHYMRLRRTGSEMKVRPPGVPGEKRKHPMYGAWAQMVNRCYNPKNSSYHRYGAVGIRVCERWQVDFLNFLADMGERPEGMTLDRIDPLGDYEPDNCRWADAKQQRANLSPVGWRDRQKPRAQTAVRFSALRKAARSLELDD